MVHETMLFKRVENWSETPISGDGFVENDLVFG